jgi:hypothetical protein
MSLPGLHRCFFSSTPSPSILGPSILIRGSSAKTNLEGTRVRVLPYRGASTGEGTAAFAKENA